MSKVQFKNDERIHEFLITIARKGNLDTIGTDLDSDRVNSDTDSDTDRANFGTDSDTKAHDSDTTGTNSDTPTSNSGTDSDTRRMKLKPKQKDIVNYCSVPRSSREILERAGVSYHSKNIQTYISSLVEAGYLGDNDRKNTDIVAGFGERQRRTYHLDHQHRQVRANYLCILAIGLSVLRL